MLITPNNFTVSDIESRSATLERMATTAVLSSRWLTKNNGALSKLAGWIESRHKKYYFDTPRHNCRPVKTIQPSEVTSPEARRTIQRFSEPIFVPSFFSDSQAVKNWTPAYFKERFSAETLRVATDLFSFEDMPVPEIVDRILTGDPSKQRYVQAVSDIFIKRPDIFDDLPMQKIFEIQRHGYHGAELFLGGPETGSTWHAANEWNFFLQVHGEKTWRLLRPEFTVDMAPAFQRDLIYLTSTKYQYESPPHITVYNQKLKPGDMLIVPPWWWHCVKNTTESSIAASIRFRTLRQAFASPNKTLSLLQFTAPHQWTNFWKEAVLGHLKNDKRYHHRADRLLR